MSALRKKALTADELTEGSPTKAHDIAETSSTAGYAESSSGPPPGPSRTLVAKADGFDRLQVVGEEVTIVRKHGKSQSHHGGQAQVSFSVFDLVGIRLHTPDKMIENGFLTFLFADDPAQKWAGGVTLGTDPHSVTFNHARRKTFDEFVTHLVALNPQISVNRTVGEVQALEYSLKHSEYSKTQLGSFAIVEICGDQVTITKMGVVSGAVFRKGVASEQTFQISELYDIKVGITRSRGVTTSAYLSFLFGPQRRPEEDYVHLFRDPFTLIIGSTSPTLIAKRDLLADFFRSRIDSGRTAAGSPASAESAPTTVSTGPREEPVEIADELKKLAELRSAGVLSEDEFNEEKSRLLDMPPASAPAGGRDLPESVRSAPTEEIELTPDMAEQTSLASDEKVDESSTHAPEPPPSKSTELAASAQMTTEGTPVPSLVGELERLATLHGQGVLSDDEFQAAKRRLIESG